MGDNLKSNLKIILFASVALFFAPQHQLYSEKPQFALGFTGGYLNVKNNVKYVYNCENCRFLDNFNKSGFLSGISFEYTAGLGFDLSFLVNLYYNNFTFSRSADGDVFQSLVPDGNGSYKTVITTTRFYWEGKYALLSLDILPKILIPRSKLGIYAGFSLSYLVNSDYNEIYKIVSPEDVTFKRPDVDLGIRYADNDRSIYLKEGEIPFKNSFRLGLKSGLSYDVEFWDLRLTPFVSVDFPLTSVVNGVNLNCATNVCNTRKDAHWKITYYQIGIDFKYLF